MTDPSHPPDPPPRGPPAAAQRPPAWEVYSVIVASVIGLLSLTVSAYTAYTLYVQTRAQVFPYLQIVIVGDQHRVGVYNKGVGPAFVKSVRVTAGDRPVTTWAAFFEAMKVHPNGSTTFSNVNHVATAANETLAALVFADPADFGSFVSLDPARYRVDVCYCSILDECWAFAQAADVDAEPHHVARCDVDRSRDFAQ